MPAFTNATDFTRIAALAGDAIKRPAQGLSGRVGPDEPAAWAPAWSPQIGERVRVRLSPECRCWQARHEWTPGMEGATGVLRSVVVPGHKTHPYVVVFDVPVPVGLGDRIQHTEAWFARIELEPADWAGPGERED